MSIGNPFGVLFSKGRNPLLVCYSKSDVVISPTKLLPVLYGGFAAMNQFRLANFFLYILFPWRMVLERIVFPLHNALSDWMLIRYYRSVPLCRHDRLRTKNKNKNILSRQKKYLYFQCQCDTIEKVPHGHSCAYSQTYFVLFRFLGGTDCSFLSLCRGVYVPCIYLHDRWELA